MPREKAGAQRKVYMLATDLVERITDYQRLSGMQSEVEAVRELLDEALNAHDDWRTITNRFLSGIRFGHETFRESAKKVLVGHPLVDSVIFEPDYVVFELATGEQIRVDNRGNVDATNEDGQRIELSQEPLPPSQDS